MPLRSGESLEDRLKEIFEEFEVKYVESFSIEVQQDWHTYKERWDDFQDYHVAGVQSLKLNVSAYLRPRLRQIEGRTEKDITPKKKLIKG